MKWSSILGLSVAASFGFFSYLGCGSNDDAVTTDDDTGGTGGGGTGGATAGTGGGTGGATGGSAGQGGSSAAGGTGGTGGATGGTGGTGGADPDGGDASVQDATFNYDAPPNDGNITQDSACAASVAEAEPVPLDIYLMLDRSGSMDPDCNVGQTVASSWCNSINAIAGFVADPSSAGMRVALEFFSGSTCSVSDYANPTVNLGYLNGTSGGQAAVFVSALNAAVPSGQTPTEAALLGMVDFTSAQQTAGRTMIGVLITDGDPTVCNTDTGDLAAIAAGHFASNGIRTFVIGMAGAVSFDKLETIAVAGGAAPHDDFCHSTTPCHHYDVGAGNPQAFIQALQQIQAAAIGCTFQMPTTDAGVIDIEKVKIEYTPGGVGAPQELVRVNDQASCVPNGWYYDDNTNPTTLNLCPVMCNTVKADSSAKIQVLLGCLGS